jgi:hypothetical protein
MSSLVVKNHNPQFANFVKRLEKRGKCAKLIIVAIMRKLMHNMFGALSGGISHTISHQQLSVGRLPAADIDCIPEALWIIQKGIWY